MRTSNGRAWTPVIVMTARLVMRASALAALIVLVVTSSVAAQEPNLANKVFFSGPQNLTHDARNTQPTSVRVATEANGDIDVVWGDDSCQETFPYSCTWHLFFSRSVDGGATFSAPMDIAHRAAGQALYAPQIAVDRKGNINVVWEDTAAGGWEIFYSRSVDGGATFSSPKVISNDAGDAVDPQLDVDRQDNISVVWQTQDQVSFNWNVWFTRSLDRGVTFAAPNALCDTTETCTWPKVAVEPAGSVNVVWAQAPCADCASDVFFSRAGDIGAGLSTPQNLSNSVEPLVTTPELVVDSRGNIHVVWSKGYYSSGPVNVFLSRSRDHGTTFVSRSLTASQGRAYFPELGVDAAGNINVFWVDDILGGIFFSRSVDGGKNYSAPKKVAPLPGSYSAVYPYIAVESQGSLNLVWEDGATGSIRFTRSTDGGSVFSSPEDLAHSSAAFFPQIVADASGNLNVLWFDQVNDSLDILFDRGVTVNSLRSDIASLPDSALKMKSLRTTMLNVIDDVEYSLTKGDTATAIADLEGLRRRLDGCGVVAGSNDWIIDCTAQLKIRRSIDIMLARLRGGSFS